MNLEKINKASVRGGNDSQNGGFPARKYALIVKVDVTEYSPLAIKSRLSYDAQGASIKIIRHDA
jgi:hypothetical protein